MTDKERDRIESAIRHIQTAVDVDPWAVEIAVEAMKAQLSREDTTSDCISRQAAIDAVKRLSLGETDAMRLAMRIVDYLKRLLSAELEQRWIPCGERLPMQGQEVICQCRASIIKVLKLDADGDWYQDADHCYMGGFVIAWMPLPDCYRGKR